MLTNKWFARGIILLLILLIIWMLYKTSFVFVPIVIIIRAIALPFIVAGVGFYIFRPAVRWAERKNIKRIYSVLFVYIVVIGILTAGFYFLRPYLLQQVNDMKEQAPKQLERLQQMKLHLVPYLREAIDEGLQMASQKADKLKNQAGVFVPWLLSTLFSLATVPFILFYMLRDERNFWQFIKYLIPRDKRAQVDDVLSEIDETIGDYIRGQITVSFLVGVLLFMGYSIIGLDYAVLLAIAAMLTNFIPYLGPFIAVTPAIIVALTISPSMIVKVIAVSLVVQMMEGNLITPHIMGKKLEIHPLTIIVLLLFAGSLAGVAGVILAVPVYAVSKVIYSRIFNYLQPKLEQK
ncbi:AI-2E family transporter [Aneurinibacillus tyrosinisolvens]|uniref:AI-2E family transporter n=1 Tax=Aneurinibacillus tyrosinisolvens TaxID=1443435 RepID=UPI000B2BCAB0|nr:AI-2E family transporter [Aneurinibacillus tyrosinisolvens]